MKETFQGLLALGLVLAVILAAYYTAFAVAAASFVLLIIAGVVGIIAFIVSEVKDGIFNPKKPKK